MSRSERPRHPPVQGRFSRGQSGNPKGRPKKAVQTPSAFDIIIDKTLSVTRGGVVREVTVDEALQHKTYQDAIAGNRAARREVLKLIAEREAVLASKDERRLPNFIVLNERAASKNADQALLLLGIATQHPRQPSDKRESLILEPWAVQLAISRRRGGARLSKRDVDHIKSDTRAAEALRWPRGSGE